MTTLDAPAAPPPEVRPHPRIEARDVTVRYGDVAVLWRVSLSVPAGARVAVLGLNGAGKSTLLRVLAGLIRPAKGTVQLDGRPTREHPVGGRSSIGYVGHESLLAPSLTVRENMLFFSRLYGVDDPRGRAADVLGEVGLLHRADDLAGTFSRGMAQRAALARALLHAPSVLLLDEPDAGLDVRAYTALRRVLHTSADRAVLLVTHSLEHALDLCDELIVLHRGRVGHVCALGGQTLPEVRRLYDAITAPRAE